MRPLLSFLVALCLTLGGGIRAFEARDPATPILTQEKLKLADAAIVKPPSVKLPASLTPDPPGSEARRAVLLSPPLVRLAFASTTETRHAEVVTPAALLAFPGHPTRAGP